MSFGLDNTLSGLQVVLAGMTPSQINDLQEQQANMQLNNLGAELARQQAQSQQAATQAQGAFQAAQQAPVPGPGFWATALPQLLGGLATNLSGNPMFQQNVTNLQAGGRQELMQRRLENLHNLENIALQKQAAARQMDNLVLNEKASKEALQYNKQIQDIQLERTQRFTAEQNRLDREAANKRAADELAARQSAVQGSLLETLLKLGYDPNTGNINNQYDVKGYNEAMRKTAADLSGKGVSNADKKAGWRNFYLQTTHRGMTSDDWLKRALASGYFNVKMDAKGQLSGPDVRVLRQWMAINFPDSVPDINAATRQGPPTPPAAMAPSHRPELSQQKQQRLDTEAQSLVNRLRGMTSNKPMTVQIRTRLQTRLRTLIGQGANLGGYLQYQIPETEVK